MTAFIFILCIIVASVGVIAWVNSLVGDIREKLAPGIVAKRPRGLQPVDWSLIFAGVELVSAALIGIAGGTDAWSAWGFFLIVLGAFELSLKEMLRWVDVVVAKIKSRVLPKSKR